MNLFENLLNMHEANNNCLWTKFSNHYNGFVPVQDMSNYFSLDQFSEFVNWARKEADLDTDMEKLYDNWDDAFEALNEINGDPENEADSISLEDIFNFFSISDLEEFWNWVEIEYDLNEDELDESTKLKEGLSTGNKMQVIINKSNNPFKLSRCLLKYLDAKEVDEIYKDMIGDLEESIQLKESTSRQNMIDELKEFFVDKDDLADYIFSHLSDNIIKDLYDEFIEYMEFEPDSIEEATSGIGGAYTTKAIDILPTGVKKVNENLYDEYLEKVMDEKSNVELVNLLHEIRDNEKLKSDDKKKLEDEIRTKVRSIKTEAITEFYGKEWSDDEIKKVIEVAKENPDAVGYIDPDECASPFNYNGKTYYTIGEGKEIFFDGKECVVFLTSDEELNRYLSYFEVSYEDEGDGESGPQELTMTFVSDVPYKVVEV